MFVASAGSSRVCLCFSVTNLLLPLHIYSQLSFHSFLVSSRQLQIVNTLVLFYFERSDPRHVQTQTSAIVCYSPARLLMFDLGYDELTSALVRSVGSCARPYLDVVFVTDLLDRNQIIVERAG